MIIEISHEMVGRIVIVGIACIFSIISFLLFRAGYEEAEEGYGGELMMYSMGSVFVALAIFLFLIATELLVINVT